jgi:hypothetical protein
MECRQFVAESFPKLPNTLRTWEISAAVRRRSAGRCRSAFDVYVRMIQRKALR